MRRRTVLAAAAAAIAVGVSGCGIPAESKVRDIGAGPEAGEEVSGGAGAGPPTRESASTKEAFVSNFLAALAGEPDKMEGRLKAYLTPDAGNAVQAGADLNIVRLRGTPAFDEIGQGTWSVKIDVTHVGVLDARGSIGEAELTRSSYTFKIAVQSTEAGAETWIVTDPPDDLLLSTDALESYYTPRTIYFWSRDRKTLVPDERYMPKELDEGRQPTRIVEWLVAGPSEWLRPAVSRINDQAKNNQNVPYPKDRLEVSLSAKAVEQTDAGPGVDVVAQLGQQLMWSLRWPYVRDGLQLWVDGRGAQVFTKDSVFYAANAANRGPEGQEQQEAQPERFALVDGKIHRLKGSPGGGTQPLPQLLLSNGVNQDIVSATLARESADDGLRTAAALVVRQDEKFKLRVVTAVGDGARPAKETTEYTSMGRAAWLKTPMDVGLVVADKGLYQFTYQLTAGGIPLRRVDLPSAIDGKVTDVSAAPDGRRIAVVAGGRVYVLGISRGGTTTVAVEAMRPVPTTVTNVVAVDWSEEAKLVVAGTGPDGKPAVWELSLDGAIEKPQFNDTGGAVRHLVAYPDDPVAASVTATVMYDRAGAAFDLAGDKPGIEASDVMGADGEVDLSQVTAPFFLLD
ncbi:LpqB family beta-propeller domain-containing protein [Phytohabitans suffuscus]|uniref:Uncharacterized protein n=1 Tax=Phytohabitans suffuscus TaxID=624315 RepID=A0A6F8YG29_9ACTN|nr:LpqB family beta-propeller domain-containing protein [Phytohabitans suffuscus]BCB85027.1 hypothetical protein Psuf_023400 [Phytohabitans suffuscus]